MASVKDAQQLVQHVESAVSDLKEALRNNNGNVDFERLAGLADEIGERADAVAETFSSLNEVLMGRIDEITGSGSRSSSGSQGSAGGSQESSQSSGRKRAKASS